MRVLPPVRMLLRLCGCVVLLWTSRGAAAPPEHLSDQRIDQRIQQHRTSQCVLTVRDAEGKPRAGVELTVRQTAHRFLFGCNIYAWGKCGSDSLEQAYRTQYRDLLNYATLGFYWSSYERQRGQTNADYVRQVAQWCRDCGIRTKGHPLVWHETAPPWLEGMGVEQVEQALWGRVRRDVAAFKGLIDTWDVVNEAVVMPDHQGGASPVAALCRRLGQAPLVRQAFALARGENPSATLILNDFELSPKYEKILRDCLDAGLAIDAIGLQSHMHGRYWGAEHTWNLCERYAKFSKPLHFTEVTIVSGERPRDARKEGKRFIGWESTPEGEATQARQAAEFYRVLFSHPAVEAITWWDFSDLRAWQAAPAGLVRKDMSPKPAYEELKKLIRGRWWTPATVLTTDAAGQVRFRGFLGEYEAVSGGQRGAFRLEKAGESAADVRLK